MVFCHNFLLLKIMFTEWIIFTPPSICTYPWLFIFKNILVYCLSLWFLHLFDRKIVDRIDSDGNGYITMDELNAWIKRVQKRYVYENVAKVWSDYDLNKDNKISWEEYKQATYGYYLGEEVHTRTRPYRIM